MLLNPTTNNQNQRLLLHGGPPSKGQHLPSICQGKMKRQESLENSFAGLKEGNSEGGIGKMVTILV